MTNFPMWLKGDKTNPTLNYSIEQRRGITGLKDEVIYSKDSKQDNIFGFDKQLDGRKFEWRGRGVMSLLKSNWEVMYFALDESWAVIHFEKTLFTPEGYDVISRNSTMEPSMQKELPSVLSDLDITARLTLIQH